jgi:ribitol-5-phosphate 2-dehydrogenase (NADP+) / D-ribitol-5-phosphate cytidylyltransferase
MSKSTKAIILASGTGERFKDNMPKQFAKLAGLPVLVHTLRVFQENNSIDEVIVTSNGDTVGLVWEYVNNFGLSKVKKVVCGGETRQE